MSSVTVAHNPFKHHFVRSLMKEANADEDAHQRELTSPDIPPKIFATDLGFMVLSLFSLVLAAMYFCIAITGYDWIHSVKAVLENSRMKSVDYTMFASDDFNLEISAEFMFVDCSAIAVGAVMTTVAIYQSHRRKLIWGYGFMVGGIVVEISVMAAATLKAGGKCNGERFGKRLDELLKWYLEGNRTRLAFLAINKLNSLQFNIVCCGKTGYMDYMNGTSNEIPSSCCIPAWARNAYCARDILDIGDTKLIDSRLNKEGCLPKALDLCEKILKSFTTFMLVLVFFRVIVAILQGIALKNELKFYQIITSEEILKADAPVLVPLAEVESEISEEISAPSIKRSIKPKPSTPKTQPIDATERYLQTLRGKGHGAHFEIELEAIENRRREAARAAEVKRLREESIRVALALAEEKKRLREEQILRLREERRKRHEKLQKKRARSKARFSELALPDSIKARGSDGGKSTHGPKSLEHVKSGPESGSDDNLDRMSLKSGGPLKHKKKGQGHPRHSKRRPHRAKSEFINEPLWTKSEGDLKTTHRHDVAHKYVGGTRGHRVVSITHELIVPHKFSIFDEEDEDSKKLGKKQKKKTKKAKKSGGESEPEGISSPKSPQLGARKSVAFTTEPKGSKTVGPKQQKKRKTKHGKIKLGKKHKPKITYTDWQDFW